MDENLLKLKGNIKTNQVAVLILGSDAEKAKKQAFSKLSMASWLKYPFYMIHK